LRSGLAHLVENSVRQKLAKIVPVFLSLIIKLGGDVWGYGDDDVLSAVTTWSRISGSEAITQIVYLPSVYIR
jgi:hypothetical protein